MGRNSQASVSGCTFWLAGGSLICTRGLFSQVRIQAKACVHGIKIKVGVPLEAIHLVDWIADRRRFQYLCGVKIQRPDFNDNEYGEKQAILERARREEETNTLMPEERSDVGKRAIWSLELLLDEGAIQKEERCLCQSRCLILREKRFRTEERCFDTRSDTIIPEAMLMSRFDAWFKKKSALWERSDTWWKRVNW